MKRREFVRKGIGAGLAAGSAMAMGGYRKAWGNISLYQDYDLVAVKGGEPGAMFDRAIQSMGGMEKFVKKGQKVRRKQVIMKADSTGVSTGNHLHFEIRRNGAAIEPSEFFCGRRISKSYITCR